MERPYTVQEVAGRTLITWPPDIELTLADVKAAVADACPHARDTEVVIVPDGQHIIIRLSETAGNNHAQHASRDSQAELAAATTGAHWNCF